MTRTIGAIAVTLAVLSAPCRATAAPDEAAAEARRHFDAARTYHDAQKYAEAVAEYEAAYRLAPIPDILYDIAQAYRQAGDATRAIDYYRRYLGAAPRGRYASVAGDHIVALEAARSSTPPSSPPPRNRERTAATPSPAPPAADAPHAAPGGTQSPERESPGRSAASKAWIAAPILVGVAALGSLGAGAGLYSSARADNEAFRSGPAACAPRCDPDIVAAARTRETAAYALLGVGGALVAADLVLWVVLPRRRSPERTVRVAPTPGGFFVEGSF